jgi:hypothetical protein
MGLPQTLQREHEVSSATTTLELRGGVVLAQAYVHAVAKRDAGRAPARPLDADGADRLLGRHASRLVEGRSPSAGHGSILSERLSRVWHGPQRVVHGIASKGVLDGGGVEGRTARGPKRQVAVTATAKWPAAHGVAFRRSLMGQPSGNGSNCKVALRCQLTQSPATVTSRTRLVGRQRGRVMKISIRVRSEASGSRSPVGLKPSRS